MAIRHAFSSANELQQGYKTNLVRYLRQPVFNPRHPPSPVVNAPATVTNHAYCYSGGK
jgi:hypothetical protein